MRSIAASVTAALALCGVPSGGTATHVLGARDRPQAYAVGYSSVRALWTALARTEGVEVRRLPALQVAEIRPTRPGFANSVRGLTGIRFVERVQTRRSAAEPALFAASGVGVPYEWQFQATHADAVPAAVVTAAASITIAVVDTGADVTAPDLAPKTPRTYDIRSGSTAVADLNGHGTFVASLAAGSTTNREGVSGFGGGARLLVIMAARPDGTVTDVDETNAIVYAVDHGARVINLSLGGPDSSATERRGIDYAAAHGVLLIAAMGNEYAEGNPAEFPAALLQHHIGLAVGASTATGERAPFSSTGSHLSLLAPGQAVFGAVASTAPATRYPHVRLPGSTRGLYGFGSGTSFAAPQVAGAAALVMAANPLLRAGDVAQLIEDSASGGGRWTPSHGYGILDVAAAVALAQGRPSVSLNGHRSGQTIRLSWSAREAARFRLTLVLNRRAERVLLDSTSRTVVTQRLRPGQRYVFTVTALDDSGSAAASSVFSVRG